MDDFVYSVESAEKSKLKALLDADPYAEKSFARVGYDLKSSESVGLPAGKYFVHFKADEDLAKGLEGVESLQEATEEEKAALLKSLEEGLDNAVSGFGNIFG